MDHTDTFWSYQVWHYQMDETSYKRMGFVTDWNKKEWSDAKEILINYQIIK